MEQAPNDKDTLVVLYYLPDNILTPYATWIADRRNPERTFWGHYFQTREEAEEDFDRRSFGGSPQLGYLLSKLGASYEEREELFKEFRGFY